MRLRKAVALKNQKRLNRWKPFTVQEYLHFNCISFEHKMCNMKQFHGGNLKLLQWDFFARKLYTGLRCFSRSVRKSYVIVLLFITVVLLLLRSDVKSPIEAKLDSECIEQASFKHNSNETNRKISAYKNNIFFSFNFTFSLKR